MTTLLESQPHDAVLAKVIQQSWRDKFVPPRHEFLAIACPEEDGGFSVFAAQIPGVVSQGENIDEARENISEAFLAMLEACRNAGEPLPYSSRPVVEITSTSRRLWVTVDG